MTSQGGSRWVSWWWPWKPSGTVTPSLPFHQNWWCDIEFDATKLFMKFSLRLASVLTLLQLLGVDRRIRGCLGALCSTKFGSTSWKILKHLNQFHSTSPKTSSTPPKNWSSSRGAPPKFEVDGVGINYPPCHSLHKNNASFLLFPSLTLDQPLHRAPLRRTPPRGWTHVEVRWEAAGPTWA